MKKMMTLLLCALLFIGLIGCTAPVDDTSSTTTTTNATTSTTTVATTTNWEGVGGVGLETELYIKDVKIAGIHGGLFQYVLTSFGRETFAEVVDEVEASMDAVPCTFVGGSTHFWVHRFDIPREKFEEINDKEKENYKDSPERWEEDVFTDEEIDDIYTLSTKEFNEKYKAPTAVLVGEFIYNFNWLYKNDIDLWQKQGFTVEQLQTAVANAKATPYFPRGIADAVEKKLNDYIAAVNA